MQTYDVVCSQAHHEAWVFRCQADDAAHAAEQATNAHPGATIVIVIQCPVAHAPSPYQGVPNSMWMVHVERQHDEGSILLLADEESARHAFTHYVQDALMRGHGGLSAPTSMIGALHAARDWVVGQGSTWEHPRLSIIVTAKQHDVWVAGHGYLRTVALARADAVLACPHAQQEKGEAS